MLTDLNNFPNRNKGSNSSVLASFSESSRLTTKMSYPFSTPWCLSCTDSALKSTIASSIILPSQTSIQSDGTEYYMPSSVTITAVVSPTRQDVTTKPAQRLPPTAAHLTSFGIFLITFGGVLFSFMIISLIWICCGRERSPEAPHPQVKLKPWSHPPDHKVDDVATEISDLPNSYQNRGLNSSSPGSPSTPNTNVGKATEPFRCSSETKKHLYIASQLKVLTHSHVLLKYGQCDSVSNSWSNLL
ncbi:uncharacterized protein LOC144632715 isoform X2 [Oculina patagonica]